MNELREFVVEVLSVILAAYVFHYVFKIFNISTDPLVICILLIVVKIIMLGESK